MTTLILPRRRFLLGLAGIIAAPAVVRAASLMKVRGVAGKHRFIFRTSIPTPAWRRLNAGDEAFLSGISQLYSDVFVYGNPDASPTQFTGFSAIFS